MQSSASLHTASIAADTTVMFVDIQHGIAEMSGTLDGKSLARGVDTLARLARLFDLPTVVSTVAPGAEKAPALWKELDERLGSPYAFVRGVPNSYEDAAIRGAVEAASRKTLVLSGVFTEIAVQLPALAFAEAGYDVHVVVDACGGSTARSEEAAFKRMTAAGVKTTSLLALIAELAGSFETPQGQKALQMVMETASA